MKTGWATKKLGEVCEILDSRRMGGGDWENKIALVAYRGPEEDGLAAYALKKVTRSSGGVMLSPINPDYAPFEVSDSAEYGASYLLVAEFKAVLFRKKELSFA